MPQTLARLYGSEETASAVVKELHDRGFSPDKTCMIARPVPDATTPTESVQDSIAKAGISPAATKVYAEGVSRGEVFVGVQPGFGYARMAIEILDRHDPIAVDLPAEVATPTAATGSFGGVDWTRDPAPLSTALGWRVLLSDPTPFSNWLNRPTLKAEPETSNSLESIRRQSDDPAPLSSKLGIKVLSDNPAPLSEKLGWRLLSDQAAPLSDKYGRKVLLDDPAPLSTKFGWRTLLDDPAPLSRILGLRVLSDR